MRSEQKIRTMLEHVELVLSDAEGEMRRLGPDRLRWISVATERACYEAVINMLRWVLEAPEPERREEASS